jgi:hypothetical protein
VCGVDRRGLPRDRDRAEPAIGPGARNAAVLAGCAGIATVTDEASVMSEYFGETARDVLVTAQ